MKRATVQGRYGAKMAGVTLIELMVVMVIIAILTSLAVPAYRSHVLKTNRRAAESCLSEGAQFMERYYTTHLTYVGATALPGCIADANLTSRYWFTTVDVTQNTYTVVAQPDPNGPQVADTLCKTLKLDQGGAKYASGTGGSPACW